MQLMNFEPMWGLTGTLAERLQGIKDRGYDGVEVGLPEFMARLGEIEKHEVADFPHILDDLELAYLPMIFTYEEDFSDRWGGMEIESSATHAATFQQQVEAAAAYAPIQMTAHSGSDAMTLSAAVAFFEAALAVENDVGIRIGHETHRMRILYSPFVWRDVHQELPDLRTVADISHWVNVCERIPDDLEDLFLSCTTAAIHIHGRVGHPEGPQVSDPRASEHLHLVEWHERWWRSILADAIESGSEIVTFDPEYGPPPYLPTLPYTGAPVADLKEIRLWARERIGVMFSELQHEVSS